MEEVARACFSGPQHKPETRPDGGRPGSFSQVHMFSLEVPVARREEDCGIFYSRVCQLLPVYGSPISTSWKGVHRSMVCMYMCVSCFIYMGDSRDGAALERERNKPNLRTNVITINEPGQKKKISLVIFFLLKKKREKE